ncbi:hypothetical protein JTA32_23745 [Pseudomonas sp. 20GA0148]|nr:hypothetical protein [Pseudomonas alliivorans]
MAPDQIARLALAICATAELLGQNLTPDAAEIMADDLADYPAQVVADALKTCRRELVGKLTLGAVLQRILGADGRPDRDEAWAIALASCDEVATVVLTDDIQAALSVARPVLNVGDRVGARMAFISAYDRIVHAARQDAKPVKWRLSLGFDMSQRASAIRAAVQSNRLDHRTAEKYLAQIDTAQETVDGVAIAGLITGKVVEPSTHIRQQLQMISDGLKRRQRQRQAVKDHRVRMIRQDLNARVNRQLALLAKYNLRTAQ